MLKIKRVLDVIYKFRVLIIAVVLLVTGAISALLITKGTLITVEACASEVRYGDQLSYEVKAFISTVEYEYKKVGDGNWQTEMPREVGAFEVRAVGKRSFGGKFYGEVCPFTIYPRATEVYVDGVELTYGESAIFGADTAEGDGVDAENVVYSYLSNTDMNVSALGEDFFFTAADGRDVSHCYVVQTSSVAKDLKVLKRDISLSTDSGSFVYDGKEHGAESYEITEGSLAEGDEISLTYVKIKNHGELQNRPEIAISSEERGDVIGFYKINGEYGKLEVSKRPLALRSKSAEKYYDGELLYEAGFDVTSGSFADDEIYECVAYSSALNVATVENELTLCITAADGEDSTENYDITWENGTLEVLPVKLSISTAGLHDVYDGKYHFSKDFTYSVIEGRYPGEGQPLGATGQTISVVTWTEVKNATVGTPNEMTFRISDNDGEDVTSNYIFERKATGSIVIDERKITLRSSSKEKVYDGKYFGLSQEDYFVADESPNGFAEGQEVEFYDFEDFKKVDTKRNIFSVRITDFEGETATDNYEITSFYGELKVLSREISVVSSSAKWKYNGEEHFAEMLEYTETSPYRLPDGHSFRYISHTALKTVAIKDNVLEFTIVDESEEAVLDNYTVDYHNGKLEVEPMGLTVYSATTHFEYDGQWHSQETVGVDDYMLEEGGRLPQGERIVVLSSESAKAKYYSEEGVENVIKVAVFAGEENVSDLNYKITYENGRLYIDKRPVSVLTGSKSAVYDDNEMFDESYTVTSSKGFVEGETVSVLAHTTVRNANEGEENVLELIVYSGIEPTTYNYDINYTYGTLKIDKRPILIDTGKAEKIYDGIALTNSYWDYETYKTGRGLLDTHTIDAQTDGSITDVGKVTNTLGKCIINRKSDNEDVTANYAVTTEGTLEVLHVKLKITTYGGTFVYDGTEKSVDGYALEYRQGDSLGKTGQEMLIDSQTIQKDVTPAAGVKNEMIFRFVNGNGDIITQNYVIEEWVYNNIIVFRRKIMAATKSMTKPYNGDYQYCAEFEIEEKAGFYNIPEWQHSEVLGYTKIKNAGEKKDNALEVHIFDEGDRDVSENYEINYTLGVLEVVKLEITVTTESRSWQYDALPHYWAGKTCTVQEGCEFPKTETLNLLNKTTITELGSEPNVLEFSVLDKDNRPTTDNYDIHYVYGELEITARNVYVGGFAEKVYDATPLTASDATMTVTDEYGNYVDYIYIEVVFTAEPIVRVGTSKVYVASYEIKDGKDDYFIVHDKEGKLEITPTLITVCSGTTKKKYDGAPLTYDYCEVKEGHLFGSDELSATAYGTITAVGSVDNPFTYKILDGIEDVTNCYSVTEEVGTLTVYYDINESIKSFTVKPVDVIKTYDGTPLTATNSLEGCDGLSNYEQLVDKGYSFVAVVSGSRTIAGESQSVIDQSTFKVFDRDGDDVTGFFDIYFNTGRIVVEKVEIEVYLYVVQKFYDGKPLVYSQDDYEIDGLPDGWAADVDVSRMKLTAAGEITKVRAEDIITVTVTDGYGADMAENVKVNFVCNTSPMTLKPLYLTISAASAEKTYDGTALSTDEYTIVTGELAEGDTIYVTIDGSLTDVGTMENVITSVTVISADGINVTDNYQIEKINGTLTVYE